MFMITKEDFLEFCKESNFRIDKYQEKLLIIFSKTSKVKH